MTKIDMHIHGAPWEYSWQNYRRSVWQGWKNGCSHIGIAEHAPRMNHRVPYRSLHFSEFDQYFNTIEEIRIEFRGQVEVLTGLELDFNDNMTEEYTDILPNLPLDFVIGSIHSMGDWIIDLQGSWEESSYREYNPDDLYREYFAKVRKAAECGLFDFIGHVDIIKLAFADAGLRKPDNLESMYKETAETLARHRVGIEINTRGLILEGVEEFYPDFELLKACVKAGVPLTISSDSHDSLRVGENFDKAVQFAKDAGAEEINIWRGRERVGFSI